MVQYSVSKRTLNVGDSTTLKVEGLDNTKGFYVVWIANYSPQNDDQYKLNQQNSVVKRDYRPSGGISTLIYSKTITENDLDITTLTAFYFNNYGDTSITSNYSTPNDYEDIVYLGEYYDKSETFNVNIYNGKKLSGIVTWLQNWFNTKEEHDEMLFTDSGWKTCTLNSGYSVYTSGTNLRVRKTGKLVQINGVFKNNSSVTSSASNVKFATIPTGYRPSKQQVKVCQGSGMARWLLTVNSDGEMFWSRYGTDSYEATSSGRWLPYTMIYMID